MSHKITVEGNFGSVDCLREELDSRGVDYSESTDGGENYMSFQKYTVYGNPLKICTSKSKEFFDGFRSCERSRILVSGIYGSILKFDLAMKGATISSEAHVGNDIVLMVAVG